MTLTPAPTAAAAPPGGSDPHGWLVAFLLDPGAVPRAILTWLAHLTLLWGPVTGPTLAVIVGLTVTVRRWWRGRCHRRLLADARTITVIPPPRVDPAGAVTLWAHLVGLLRPGWARLLCGQPHLAWEYLAGDDGIRIQLWVPGAVPPRLVERAIEAAWPGAHTRTIAARPPVPLVAVPATRIEDIGGELRLARCEALPLRTAFPADPVHGLLSAAATTGAGHERIAVQILARPVTGGRVRRARGAARRLLIGGFTGALRTLLTPQFRSPTPSQTRRGPVTDHLTQLETTARDRVVTTKLAGPLYECRIRYTIARLIPTPTDTTSGPGGGVGSRPRWRGEVSDHLRGRAHAIASAFAPFTSGHNRFKRVRLTGPSATLAARRLDRGDLLSIEELAGLAHLPAEEVPGLRRTAAKTLAPPPDITRHPSGSGDDSDVKPLGVSDSPRPVPVGLRVADARHHLHLLGATGAGKSELMARMILADAAAGRGLVVIDPKGDLVNDVLARLPEHLGPRVVLFDADGDDHPVLNPLDGGGTDPARIAYIVDSIVSIFSRVYATGWGPRSEDILRSGLLTLRALPGTPTLADLPTLLTLPDYRRAAIEVISDDVLRGFWRWYESLSDIARGNVTAPLLNKLRGLLLRPFVRAAIAGGASTVDMDAVLDGGILLVRLAADALGLDTARLVGSLVVARAWQAATRRARLPQHDRRDCAVYIDECQHFLNLPHPLEDLLAEARGYRMSMVLAHQYLRQLPRELAEGISTNARSKIMFKVSPEDARTLARHTAPHLTEHDLAHLGRYRIAARLLVRGQETQPFTAITEALPPAIPGRAQRIRQLALANTQPAADPAGPTQANVALDPRRAA